MCPRRTTPSRQSRSHAPRGRSTPCRLQVAVGQFVHRCGTCAREVLRTMAETEQRRHRRQRSALMPRLKQARLDNDDTFETEMNIQSYQSVGGGEANVLVKTRCRLL